MLGQLLRLARDGNEVKLVYVLYAALLAAIFALGVVAGVALVAFGAPA